MRGFPANLYERLEPLESLLDGLQNTKRGSRASVQEEHVSIHAVRVLLGNSLEGVHSASPVSLDSSPPYTP